MKNLKIIAEKKIPFLDEFFLPLGELVKLPSSQINNRNIRNSDILLVRSVNKVDRELLEGTKVKIVGSMTSGIDHIDRNYLRKNGIKLVYAPGSNARSVAEYVIACLLVLAKKKGISLNRETIGIIGVGNVGKMVAEMSKALRMKVLLNDPPKFVRTKDKKYLSLRNLGDAGIITLHVPLTVSGKYKTYRMVNGEFLKKLKRETILINTSRGGVIDEEALLKYRSRLKGLVLDVWKNEPMINIELLKTVDIGTPHIAGYSVDGKFNATYMVYRKLCKILGKKMSICKEEILPVLNGRIEVTIQNQSFIDILRKVVLNVYNPINDHNALMEIIKLKEAERRNYFESLRLNYPIRREFFNYRVCLKNSPGEIMRTMQKLGFR